MHDPAACTTHPTAFAGGPAKALATSTLPAWDGTHPTAAVLAAATASDLPPAPTMLLGLRDVLQFSYRDRA